MTNTALSTQAAAKAPAAPKPAITTGGVLSALVPQDLDQAFRLAQALSGAGDMVPKHYQGQPQAIMAAIVRGMEIGLAPMQSLASIAVINGRASLWGDALVALVMRAGHHIDAVIENEDQIEKARAVATLTRADGKQVVRTFSYQDAKRAGLTEKAGPWKQYPLRMLANRARGFAVRDGAADALMGLSVADEVSDYGPDAARGVTPRQAAPRPGRAMYVDPDPVIDEIHEAEPAQIEGPSDLSPTADDLARAEAEALAEIGRHDAEAEQGRLV